MSSEQENNENEANVDLKGVIKELQDEIKELNKLLKTFGSQIQGVGKGFHKTKQDQLEIIKAQGDMVKSNLEFRNSLQNSTSGMQMFTGLLTKGASAGLIFNKLANTIGGVSKELDAFKKETIELAKIEKKAKGLNLGLPENKKLHDELAAQQEATDKAKEKMDAKKGGSGKLAEGISSMKEFAEKHKTGILIGAGSIGILLTILKKAFDVSPMFQAIKKLLQFGFMLILRPIGDFFGFIMRPIMVMMLRKFIIPWYKDVYPVMKKLGTWLGNWVAGAMEKAGDPATIAAVAIGSAAVITAIAVIAKKLTIGLATSVVKNVMANLGIKIPAKVPVPPKVPSSPVPKPPKLPPPPKPPVIKLPPAIQKGLVKIAALPAVIKAGVNNAVIKSVDKIKNVAAPIVKTLTSPKLAAAAADLVKFAPKILKFSTRAIPIVGTALLGVDAIGSGLKHFSPETYEGVRQGGFEIGKMLGDTEGTNTEAVMDFFGFGKKSTMEQIAGAVGYGANKLGIQTGTSGIGGMAGVNRGNAGNGVTINIANVSNEADIQRMGNVMQERIQESNKRTVKSY